MTSPATTLERGEFKNEPIRDFLKAENRAAMEQALKKVAAELGKEYPLLIGGEKIFTTEKTRSTNPTHPSQVVGIFQKGTIELANQAVEAADKAFASWKTIPAAKRAWYCFEVAEILKKRRFEMDAWLCYETGKTWTEADADTAELIDFCEFYAREMLRLGGPQKLVPNAGEKNHLVYIPLGVGIVIPPWNFAAAIMGGMTLAAIVTGSTAGEALVSHPKTRFIAFTGSKEAGNPVVALWMNQNAVVYTRGTTHHKGDAIMETPPRDPGDLGVAHGAGPALELPEKAKSPRTPKRFCHMISFAFFGAPGLSWRTEQVSQFATGRPYLADVGFQCEKLLLDVLEFGIAQIVQVGRIWLAVPESLGGHIQGREIIPDGNL